MSSSSEYPTSNPTQLPTVAPTFGPSNTSVVLTIFFSVILGIYLVICIYFIFGNASYISNLKAKIYKSRYRNSLDREKLTFDDILRTQGFSS